MSNNNFSNDMIELVNMINKLKTKYNEITNNYSEEDVDNINTVLDKNLAKFLGIKKNKKENIIRKYNEGITYYRKKWLEEEYCIVKKLFAEDDENIEYISKYLGRTEYSIECVLLKLNLVTTDIDGGSVFIRKIKTSESIIENNNYWNRYKTTKLLENFELFDDIKELYGLYKTFKNHVEEDLIDKKLEQLGLIEII